MGRPLGRPSATAGACGHVLTICVRMGASGVLEGLEECDDGDIEDGDGCSAGCKVRCPGPALKRKEPLAVRAWAYVLDDSR